MWFNRNNWAYKPNWWPLTTIIFTTPIWHSLFILVTTLLTINSSQLNLITISNYCRKPYWSWLAASNENMVFILNCHHLTDLLIDFELAPFAKNTLVWRKIQFLVKPVMFCIMWDVPILILKQWRIILKHIWAGGLAKIVQEFDK